MLYTKWVCNGLHPILQIFVKQCKFLWKKKKTFLRVQRIIMYVRLYVQKSCLYNCLEFSLGNLAECKKCQPMHYRTHFLRAWCMSFACIVYVCRQLLQKCHRWLRHVATTKVTKTPFQAMRRLHNTYTNTFLRAFARKEDGKKKNDGNDCTYFPISLKFNFKFCLCMRRDAATTWHQEKICTRFDELERGLLATTRSIAAVVI